VRQFDEQNKQVAIYLSVFKGLLL